MTCEEHKPKLSAYVDGEIPADERKRLEEHLAACEDCRQELAELTSLKEDLKMIRFREPTDAEIERFWRSVYNRLERGVGWILFSVGAIVLLCYGAFKLVEEVIRDPTVAWAVKIGVVAVLFGGVILFVSLLRERLAIRKKDRYSREVRR